MRGDMNYGTLVIVIFSANLEYMLALSSKLGVTLIFFLFNNKVHSVDKNAEKSWAFMRGGFEYMDLSGIQAYIYSV